MVFSKVHQTNFFYAKARTHDQAKYNGAFSKLIAAMVRKLYTGNKKKKKTKWAVLAVSVLNVGKIPKLAKGTNSSILTILSLFIRKKIH